MTLTKDQLEFENRFRSLIGRTVNKVEYTEISYEPNHPSPYYPTQFKNLDSVDFSIFLFTDNDNIVEIYWSGRFHQYGIDIKINEPSDFSDFIKWDVSVNELWIKFIGTKITDFKISWETVTATEENTRKTERFIYPQDIRITFSNNKRFSLALQVF
jgi:hypothetical protein